MNRLHRILLGARGDLDSVGVAWCLVGGLAVSVWANPRLTRDVDIAVAVDDDREAEKLIRKLGAGKYRVEEIVEQEALGRLATARLSIEEEPNGVVIDLLFASSGIEAEAVSEALQIEIFEGLAVPVAPRPHLLVMKLLARDDRDRPLDADDIRALLEDAAAEDIERARELIELVLDRGFHRGRDLRTLLEEALAAR